MNVFKTESVVLVSKGIFHFFSFVWSHSSRFFSVYLISPFQSYLKLSNCFIKFVFTCLKIYFRGKQLSDRSNFHALSKIFAKRYPFKSFWRIYEHIFKRKSVKLTRIFNILLLENFWEEWHFYLFNKWITYSAIRDYFLIGLLRSKHKL